MAFPTKERDSFWIWRVTEDFGKLFFVELGLDLIISQATNHQKIPESAANDDKKYQQIAEGQNLPVL